MEPSFAEDVLKCFLGKAYTTEEVSSLLVQSIPVSDRGRVILRILVQQKMAIGRH